jgi:hypothetical protein
VHWQQLARAGAPQPQAPIVPGSEQVVPAGGELQTQHSGVVSTRSELILCSAAALEGTEDSGLVHLPALANDDRIRAGACAGGAPTVRGLGGGERSVQAGSVDLCSTAEVTSAV